jgi:hypothetical protein
MVNNNKRRTVMEQIKRTVLDLKYYFERSLPLILIGAALGYTFASHLEEKRAEPVEIGFATVEDMSFLISELEECRINSGSLEDSY